MAMTNGQGKSETPRAWFCEGPFADPDAWEVLPGA
jgi:hypothetical protein